MIELRWLVRTGIKMVERHEISWADKPILQYRDTTFIPDRDWRDVPTVKEEEE